MSLTSDLLGDVLGQLQRPGAEAAASPTAASPARWVTDLVLSGRGSVVLQRAGLADQVDTVLDIAAVLARSGRRSSKAIARDHSWSLPLVQRARRALTQIAGLEQLGRSWAPDPVGKIGSIPVWNGRERWLLAVSLELHSDQGKAAINHHKSSRPLVMRVARHDAKTADGRTGRGVRTSHDTVAHALRVSRDAVRHARYVLESIGMSVTVVQGRYLTAGERAAAHAHHGGWQRRIASTRHLTMPRRLVQLVARHLPRSGSDSSLPLASSKSPRRAGASKKRPVLARIPLPWQKLAGQVAAAAPHLGNRHIGNLARALMRIPIDPTAWTGHALVHLISVFNRDRGLSQPESSRNTIGLFIHQVSAATAKFYPSDPLK